MSDPTMSDHYPRRKRQWGRQRIGHISPDKPPRPEDVADHAERHKGDDADRFSLYTPQQINEETKDVKLCIVFDEPIRIRDQAEMIMGAMEEIMELTKDHDLGSVKQRMQCRHVAKVLGRALTRFNGKTPYGEYRRKR